MCHCSEHSNGEKAFQVRRGTLRETRDGRGRCVTMLALSDTGICLTCHCSEHSNGEKAFQVRRGTLGETRDGRCEERCAVYFCRGLFFGQ
ncbi:hypothetical protein NDU88_006828 [Pleurodeles waltl]|uniref:Uncharacterized protein n=1 Tax=Pleurodeles waltl TaxID=8319 RepID=A0AAV7SQQ4_PLEWA|nr:hypothetical protein NDU88_006828 [Pleurodeles waltl]